VKICGMHSELDVQICASAGADALGFIFAQSPRRLTIDEAEKLSAAASSEITRVGVFVDSPRGLVEEAIAACRLDMLQFAGKEAPEFCGRFGLPTIIVAHEGTPTPQALRDARAAAVMLDSREPGKAGGTGMPVPLDRARRTREQYSGHLILAGGLRPETVAHAVREVGADGVDVRSGVERDGFKDRALVAAFVTSAKEALHARA
jgi:phosphoribosylanthranilate isomerase